jgi:glucokinase
VRRLGIDIGGTKTLCVVVDDSFGPSSVTDERRVPTDPQGDAASAIVDLVRTFDDIASVGIGIAGLVTRDGSVPVTTHLPGVRDLPLGQRLSSALGIPVTIDNDATCAVIAEWKSGAAVGYDDVLMVTLGTGIGGGAIVDGRPARGHNGFAGEFGHMVVQRGGLECPCGRRGCWESYASGGGLSRLAGGASAESVMEAFVAGDPGAVGVVDEFVDWVVLGLYNLVHIHDPACIVVGGGLGSQQGIIDLVTRRFADGPTGHAGRAMPRIVAASLGERSGAIGAAIIGAGY